MPGPRNTSPQLDSPEEIVYREFGGSPPRLSAAAARGYRSRRAAQAPGAVADTETLTRVGAAWVAILSTLLVLADFALFSLEI
jgi:hypothetical protein